MPQIPASRFGDAVAQPGGLAQVPQLDTSGRARGINAGVRAAVSAEVERDTKIRETHERATALTALNTTKDQIAGIAEEVAGDVLSGKLDGDEAEEIYRRRSEGVAAQLPELSPSFDAIVRAEVGVEASGRVQGIRRAATQRRQRETSAAIITNAEALERQYASDPGKAANDFNSMLESLGPDSDMQPEQLAALRGRFAERTSYTSALSAFHAAGDDPAALARVSAAVSDPSKWSGMDPTMRENLGARVDGRRETLRQRAEHQAAMRESQADRAFARAAQIVSTGFPLDEDAAQSLIAATRGTSVAGDAAVLVAQNRSIQAVLSGPIPEQLATVQAMRARLTQQGTGSAVEISNLARLEAAVANNVKQVRENPLLVLQQRNGVEIEPLNVAKFLDARGTGEHRDLLQARIAQLRAVGRRMGPMVGDSPLLPQEVAQLQIALSSAQTASERAQVFGSLRIALVATRADNRYYTAALKQLASTGGQSRPVDRVLLVAGDLYASNPAAAAYVLRGKHADPKVFSPNEGEFADAFRVLVGDAFRGREQAFSIAQQTARAYYMGKVAESGKPPGSQPGTTDDALVEEAVNQAIGIPVEHGDHTVLAPPGMDEGTFRERLQAAWLEAVDAGKIPEAEADNLDDYSLQNGSDGYTYGVIRGRRFVKGSGGDLQLNIDPARTIKTRREPAVPALPAGIIE